MPNWPVEQLRMECTDLDIADAELDTDWWASTVEVWERLNQLLAESLELGDLAMASAHSRRYRGNPDFRFCFEAGDLVMLRELVRSKS